MRRFLIFESMVDTDVGFGFISSPGGYYVGAQDVKFLVWASGRLFGLPEIFNRITFPTIYIGGAYATPPCHQGENSDLVSGVSRPIFSLVSDLFRQRQVDRAKSAKFC